MSMSTFLSVASVVAIAVVASACAPAEEPESASETASEELRFCRDDAPTLPDRTVGKTPLLGATDVTVAASLPYPPGNVATDADGRVFLSLFPDTNYGSTKVGMLDASGKLAPFPSAEAQSWFHSVLGIRMDRLGRLWVLDHGNMGLHRPKLWAFDAKTGAKRIEWAFPVDVAPLGSMMNDVQIAPDGKTAYVSDASLVFGKPAIVVVDLTGPTPRAHRALERHASVTSGKYDVVVEGKKARIASLLCAEGGVDGIALDASGAFLYYAPLNSGVVSRIPTAVLRDPRANHAAAVTKVADATMTDGMTADSAGNVYLTDMEHSSVVRVRSDGSLEVVARDVRLRWPDGFAWAPDGDLYVTASAIHLTLAKPIRTEQDIAKMGPYHLLRLRMPR